MLFLSHTHDPINYFMVLTQVGDTIATRKINRDKFLKYVRRAGYHIEWAYQYEMNSRGTGYHMNAYVRGDCIPPGKLNELSGRAGMGNVACKMVPFSVKHLGYGVTMITRYNQHAEYLTINGGSLIGQSRDFYRDDYGRPCNKEQAKKAVRRSSAWRFSLADPFPDTPCLWADQAHLKGW